MSKKGLILLVVWLLAICGATAQDTGKTVLELQRNSDGSITALFRCHPEGFSIDSNGYAMLIADGMNHETGGAGEPMLPTASRLLTVPRGSKLELSEWTVNESTTLSLADGRLIAPTPKATAKDDWPAPTSCNKRTYSTDGYFRPCPTAVLEHIGTMGRSEVYRLTVAPAVYNPVRGKVLFDTEISLLLTASYPPTTDYQPLATNRYLIVAPLQFRDGLQRFADWKRQEGFAVDELYVETDNRDSIKVLVDSHEADFILLVGDAALLPPFIGTSLPTGFTSHFTDLYYAERTGDYLPDALLGRWPVNDTSELRIVVDKTLSYEQGLPLDTALLSRALLVAGREGTQPAPVTTNGQVNYVGQRLAQSFPGLDTICYRNPASDGQSSDILSNIADGTALVNYTAHCTTSGWNRPTVDHTSIDTLDESQPSFYINNCCLSNAFSGDCFGEQLLRKERGGGVAVIGATNSTLWNEDYYWAVGPKYPFSLTPQYDTLLPGAFDSWLDNSSFTSQTAGGILAAGNMAVTAFGSPYDKFYWEIYCLLGDPSIMPYLGVPQLLWVTMDDTARVGMTTLHLHASPGARVTALQGTTLLAVTTATADSNATLMLAQPLDTLPLIVTATAPQSLPTADTITPILPQGAAVSFRQVTPSDTAVDFMLANIGTDTLHALTVRLLCDTTQAIFTSAMLAVDTLLPGAEQQLHIAIEITAWAPLWSGTLTVQDAAGLAEPCNVQLGHSLGTSPTMTFALLRTDGTAATEVEPNTEYIITATVDGIYDSITLEVSTESNQLQLDEGRFTTPDSLGHLHLHGHVSHCGHGRDYDYWISAGCRADGFEEGFDSHPWNLSTMRPWILDSIEKHNGTYSLRSAPIEYRQTSDLLLDVLLMADDSISFWVKISSEEGCDKLSFSIDGQHRGSWSGLNDWQRRVYAIPAGRHTLRWRYTKDESGNSWRDCGWIDDLRLPLALWDSVYGWCDTTVASDPIPQEGIAATDSMTLHVSPNPTHGPLTIEAAGEVTLTDIYGRTALKTHCDGHSTINIGAMPAGVYFVTIHSHGTVAHTKIMKE